MVRHSFIDYHGGSDCNLHQLIPSSMIVKAALQINSTLVQLATAQPSNPQTPEPEPKHSVPLGVRYESVLVAVRVLPEQFAIHQ